MGVSFYVNPLYKEYDADGRIAVLEGFGAEYPRDITEGRFPTLEEIRAVLRDLEGYIVEHEWIGEGRWSITVSVAEREDAFNRDAYARLECAPYCDDVNAPQRFYFPRAHEESVVLIMERLARFCGPFFVFSDDGAFVVITRGTRPGTEWHFDWTGAEVERASQ